MQHVLDYLERVEGTLVHVWHTLKISLPVHIGTCLENFKDESSCAKVGTL